MVTRGHIFIILSSAIITIGILFTIIFSIDATRPFLMQDISVANHMIKAGESRILSINVSETGPIMSIVIKAEPPHVPISAIVKDQNDLILSRSSFSDDLVSNFKPQINGKYDLIITNEGTEQVKADTILGYLSLFDKNENPNISALGDIFTGVSLIILGNLGFIAGVMVIIRDKSLGYKGNMCAIWKLIASKIIRYFKHLINKIIRPNSQSNREYYITEKKKL
jgi:hypothetical protein